MGTWRLLTWGMLGLSACALPSSGKGDACTRSSQCAAGLGCVQRKCSDNLSSIASQSQVPDLMQGPAAGGDDGG